MIAVRRRMLVLWVVSGVLVRDDWYPVGPSLADVLDRYYDAMGEKYWERDD